MDDWQITSIGEQATLQRGFDITRKEQIDGPFPVVSSGGVSSFHGEAKVRGPGVILGRKGVVGSVYYQRSAFWPHDTTLWVKDFHGNNERFVFYFFRSIAGRLSALDVGSANPTLNRNHVHPIRVPWPPRRTQDCISDLLGALDDKIALNRRMNETLEAMAQAIFRDWFVDFGPTRRKLEGATDPVTIMGGLVQDAERARALAELFPGALSDSLSPVGWTTRAIGDLANIVGGSTPPTATSDYWEGGTHLWATPRDLSRLEGLHLFETERRVTDSGLGKISSGLSPSGTVLLSSRAPIGYLAITTGPTAVNQGFIAIRPNTDLPTSFALCWCRENMESIKAHANGSTFQEISKGSFRPLLIIDGGRDARRSFDGLVAPMLELCRARSDENRTLAATRDLLLPKLMSGEIRLREAEEMLEAAQ